MFILSGRLYSLLWLILYLTLLTTIRIHDLTTQWKIVALPFNVQKTYLGLHCLCPICIIIVVDLLFRYLSFSIWSLLKINLNLCSGVYRLRSEPSRWQHRALPMLEPHAILACLLDLVAIPRLGFWNKLVWVGCFFSRKITTYSPFTDFSFVSFSLLSVLFRLRNSVANWKRSF